MWLAAAMLCVAGLCGSASGGELDKVERSLEALIGKALARSMELQYGTLDNPLLTEWVDGVGQRVAQTCPRQEHAFKFRILDTPERNAFALPGAYIFVTRGLLAGAGSDDELASILAHEVGHVWDKDFHRTLARRFMYVGLGKAVEETGSSELLMATSIYAILDMLHHSRRHESRADRRAVEVGFAARYDPAAGAVFFNAIAAGRRERRKWHKRLLATHPDSLHRHERTIELSRAAKAADPQALQALIEDLTARRRYGQALENLELAQTLDPGSPDASLGAARLHLMRGDPTKCIDACRQVLGEHPDHVEAADLLREARAEPPTPEAEAGPMPSEEPSAITLEEEQLKALQRLCRQLERDRRFNDALTWVQAYNPELDDWRWGYLLLRTRMLLLATDRLRWRVGEVSGLCRSGSAAWENTAGHSGPQAAEQASEWYNSGVARGHRAAEKLQLVVQLLPPLLSSLLMMGPDDPLGRMSGTRFAVMEADLLLAQSQIRDALEDTRVAARDVARAETVRMTCALDTMGARATPRQRVLYEGLGAERLQAPYEAVRDGWESEGGFGRSACALAMEAAGWGSAEPTYAQAEAVRITLRVLTAEVKTETIDAVELTARS